ncbi:MAG: DUF2161 family putative PD-(D/E)XK-type phosphodiesterase [Pseudoruegeria sp.]
MATIFETDLYAPVKSFLEGQGYEVKSEVGSVDIVAIRGEDTPVLVEMKTAFSLTLFHQGVARQSISDVVYIAVPRGRGKRFQSSLKSNVSLCRRLGLGLLTVRLSDDFVEAHLDPAPYTPRKSKPRLARLLREFSRREGDPNKGGTKGGIVTAYRQDAEKIATYLAQNGPARGQDVARATMVERATAVMAANHYGWFERVERGIYTLTPAGKTALSA